MNVSTRPDVYEREAIIRTHWITPHSDATIDHYIVKYTLGGVETNATSTTEEAAEAVKRGHVYLVTVAAVSVIGVGMFSEPTEVKSYDGKLQASDHFLPMCTDALQLLTPTCVPNLVLHFNAAPSDTSQHADLANVAYLYHAYQPMQVTVDCFR